MEHIRLANEAWGIKPVLFHIGSFELTAYTFFVVMGMGVGILVYFIEAKKVRQVNESSFLIVAGAFIGSTIGAKLLEFLLNIDRFHSGNDLLLFLISGRTIVGGLIGGTFGVWITKRLTGIKAKRGNLFAPAIAIGVAVGRLGCFFNGCCYGKPTALPWAVDPGDEIMRHPTPVYESAFMLLMFFVLKFGFTKREVKPGFLFNFLMLAYFIFRFLVEFIREERVAFSHLTYFQLISIFVIIYLLLADKQLVLRQLFLKQKSKKQKGYE
ncbi:MAG: prolipoprotein diacylglyceryl transferase [Prevotellaceae bacterium]|jgi:phosphatidylglycerol:prolipoprotein diacylglycerol transferase|nr:prolipoprotein diacylglyceryl transferase [Prevotellaceae bacterium]